MGKIRFKLSHVMPHVWFYKLKEIGKTGDSYSKSAQHTLATVHVGKAASSGRIYACPANHKAIDIHFPETPKKSPLHHGMNSDDSGSKTDSSIAGFVNVDLPSIGSAVSQREPSEALVFTDERESTINNTLPISGKVRDMPNSEAGNYGPDNSHASEGKAGSRKGVSLDVRELERRLKALGSEERRKYYSSPVFSAAMPSPIFDCASQETSDLLDYSFGNLFEEDRICPINVIQDESKVVEGSRSSNASTSFRQSTSSLDTAVERASSSIWEKDVLSFTSEGSDLFTAIDEVDSSLPRRSFPQKKTSRWKMRQPSTFAKAIDRYPLFQGNNDSVHSDSFWNDSLKYWQVQANEEPIQNLPRYEECSLPIVQYEGVDHNGRHKRGVSNEFSYSESKDRLLSGSLSFEQCSDSALSETEVEFISKSSSRFKLTQQRGDSRCDIRTTGRSADPGHYKVSCKKSAGPEVSATGVKEHGDKRSLSKSSSRGSSCDKRFSDPNVESNSIPGSNSWYKGTLRVVKENTGEKSSQQISTTAHSKIFDSFAMVKCSYDPHQDFKDSMVEMILEKELQSANDFVELLQCYLTLNSENYHDTIVKVFGEVWSEFFRRV